MEQNGSLASASTRTSAQRQFANLLKCKIINFDYASFVSNQRKECCTFTCTAWTKNKIFQILSVYLWVGNFFVENVEFEDGVVDRGDVARVEGPTSAAAGRQPSESRP